MTAALSVFQIVSPPRASGNGAQGITGPERRAANLAGQWAKLGIDVTVLYPRRGALWDRFIEAGVGMIDYEVDSGSDWRAAVRLIELARSHAPDVIHSQGGPAVDLVTVLAAKVLCMGAIITRPVMFEDQVDRSALYRTIVGSADRFFTLRGSSAVVAVSRDGQDRLRRSVRAERLHLIHNGVQAYSDRRPDHPIGGPLHVGMVGHLLSYKGWPDFLAVAARLKAQGYEIRWHIVGEGAERGALEALTRTLGLSDQVVFHGLLQNVSPILFMLDLFLFTSHREGLSVAVLEAMSAGLPIVATEVAGIRDQVTDGYNGFVLPVGDVDGLAERTAEILCDPALRRTLGRNSRRRLELEFSEGVMLERYAALYRKISAASA